ncbi:MAG: oligosaccharide flippase family protein [Ignavibacteria bacterium]|nr:oligosaccharide flippase family protein [Ignavibacteria bacterium]
MAKNLSYDDYAIVGYFTSFSILFLPMLSLSISSYYLRNYYLIPDEKRESVLNTITISLLGIGAVTSIITLVGFFTYYRIANVSFPFWPFAFFTIFQIVFNNFLILLQIHYRIKREAKKFAKLTIFSSLFWVTSAVLFVVVLKFGATGSMGANLLVAFIFGIYCFKKMLTKIEFNFKIFKDALKFSWPLAFSAMLWYFFSGIDRVFLEKLDDTQSFALYNIGLSLSAALAMFYKAILQTFEPDIYKAIAENKIKKLAKIIFGIVFINALPVLIFVLFAKPITYILTAGRYTDAADFARILALQNISFVLFYSVITVIIGFGYTKSELGLRIVGAIICFFLYKFLIAKFGFYGAAWGQVVSLLLMAVLGVLFIYFILKNKKPIIESI